MIDDITDYKNNLSNRKPLNIEMTTQAGGHSGLGQSQKRGGVIRTL